MCVEEERREGGGKGGEGRGGGWEEGVEKKIREVSESKSALSLAPSLVWGLVENRGFSGSDPQERDWHAATKSATADWSETTTLRGLAVGLKAQRGAWSFLYFGGSACRRFAHPLDCQGPPVLTGVAALLLRFGQAPAVPCLQP